MTTDTSELDIQIRSYRDTKRNGLIKNRFSIAIRDPETGQVETGDCPMDANILNLRLESMVVQRFAHTEMAGAIRRRRHMEPVSLIEGYGDYAFTNLHTALRKSCDGPATALWWNFFQKCSPLLIDVLKGKTLEALKELENRPILLSNVASNLKLAWNRALDSGIHINSLIQTNRCREIPIFTPEIEIDRLMEMEPRDLEAFGRDMRTASMMVNCLTMDDWANMAASLVDFKS